MTRPLLRSLAAALFVLALALVASACGSRPPLHPTNSLPELRRDGLWASAAEVDITPPPGLSLFGHGPEGRIARGVRLRLRCQVFVLAGNVEGGQEGDAIALVPCDLAAPSLELQREIASRVRAKGARLGADRILLLATHTHAGPAHYFGSRKYSGTFSTKQPGFDSAVLDFLGERIAGAIASAYRTLRPACAGWQVDDEVYGLSRNRSLRAYLRNATDTEEVDEPSIGRSTLSHAQVQAPAPVPSDACREAEDHRPLQLTPSEAAVDPMLSVLRLTARTGDTCEPGEAIGVFAVFGVHPTAISNANDLYHGDLFGYATRDASSRLRPGLIVGIANGAEGDVSPNWAVQSPREARRLGRRLAEHVACAYDRAGDSLRADVPIHRAYRDLTWSGAATGDGACPRLCGAPELGTPAAGGAEDGPTRFRIVPAFNEGYRLPRSRGCHGVRVPLLGPTGNPSSDGLEFPNIAPLAAVRVGDHVVLAAPAELTTITAKRIRKQALLELGPGADERNVVVVGLANAYVQYIATRAEYDQQDYEGASTLYGPCSESFVASHFRRLTRIAFGNPADDLGQTAPLDTPIEIPSAPLARADRYRPLKNDPLPSFQSAYELREVAVEGYWAVEMTVRGVPPEVLQARDAFNVELVCAKCNTVLDDDRGTHFVLRYEPQDDAWTVRWEPDTDRVGCAGPVFLRVNGPARVQSSTFTPKCGRYTERAQ